MIRYWLLRSIAVLALVIGGYALAGLIGGLVPANAGWHAATEGITVYVEDNGIHTGIIVPVVAAGVDWRRIVRLEAFRDLRFAGHGWRAFGWGDRDFYIGTPTWADVDPLVVATAAVGSGASVLHVEALPTPQVGPRVRAVVLRPAEYRRLAEFIAASFAGGKPVHGYGASDAFYPATGRYSALRTCNVWTGEALKAAGVRLGQWTPFPAGVMRWLS